MIRLLMLLCAGLFLTLQIGGADRGQTRFGLMAAANAPATVVPSGPQSLNEIRTDAGPAQADAALVETASALPVATPAVLPVGYTAGTQLVTDAAQPALSDAQAPDLAASQDAPLKYVQGRSVNVRSGPSTSDPVVGRLGRGEAVTVVWVEDNGWARVLVEGDGIDGFMSMAFLGDTAP